jgi:hypothetical protein
MTLKIRNDKFIDDEGRAVLLRGVNLGANCKYPSQPYSPTHVKTDFSNHRNVSFVGHPFPLGEADEHLSRLKRWGFNAIRFLVSWEAIEHAGPKRYDNEYIEYVGSVLDAATRHGFYTIIDAHQDVWARMTGGDGAPGWTFEKVGLDFTKFDATEAALVMQYRYDPSRPDAYPPLYWSENVIRFACCTMFTLFFGGNDFAPSCRVDGVPAQEFLQGHFFDSMKKIATRVKDNGNVLGFDVLNEPPQGWIEIKVDGSNYKGLNETLGYTFTPIDAMATASGFPRTVGYREVKKFGIKETRKDELNKRRERVWLPGHDDIWCKEGIWGIDGQGKAGILKNEHFMSVRGKNVDFFRDYLSPFIVKFTKAMRETMPSAMIFLEASPERVLKGEAVNYDIPPEMEGIVFAPHWYDAATLGMKRPMLAASFDMMTNRPILTKGSIAEMFVRQLARIKQTGQTIRQNIPVLLAEFGLPYDMNNKESFGRSKTDGEKAWEKQVECLSLYYDALDANLLHSLQWNYTPTNDNDHGDGWNLEDLSMFSKSQRYDPSEVSSGGRAISGFCRPRCVACAGIPESMSFNKERGRFSFKFKTNAEIKAPTRIHVPEVQYPNGCVVEIVPNDFKVAWKGDELLIYHTRDGSCEVSLTRKD